MRAQLHLPLLDLAGEVLMSNQLVLVLDCTHLYAYSTPTKEMEYTTA